MGAVTNMRPDLFRVVVAQVPFVDVMNTMLDASIPLTVTEYEEWGDPNEKRYYDYMMSYSPYDNVAAKDYPNILITAGLNDPRVQYWEPAKWTAKLRALKTDSNRLLLKTNMGAGHGGASGRSIGGGRHSFESPDGVVRRDASQIEIDILIHEIALVVVNQQRTVAMILTHILMDGLGKNVPLARRGSEGRSSKILRIESLASASG